MSMGDGDESRQAFERRRVGVGGKGGASASRRKIGMIKPKPPPGSPLPRPLGHMPRFKVPNMKHASPVFSL